MKKCPYCTEMIQDEAIVCRYCKRDIPLTDELQPSVAEAKATSDEALTKAHKGGFTLSSRGMLFWLLGISLLVLIVLFISLFLGAPASFLIWIFALDTEESSSFFLILQLLLCGVAFLPTFLMLVPTWMAWSYWRKKYLRASLVVSVVALFPLLLGGLAYLLVAIS